MELRTTIKIRFGLRFARDIVRVDETYHFENFRAHERFDERQNFVEKWYNVQYMNLAQCARNTFLHIAEELSNRTDTYTRQMSNAHISHVKQKYYASLWSELMHANVCNFQQNKCENELKMRHWILLKTYRSTWRTFWWRYQSDNLMVLSSTIDGRQSDIRPWAEAKSNFYETKELSEIMQIDAQLLTHWLFKHCWISLDFGSR